MSTKMTIVALVAVMIIAIGGYLFPKVSGGKLFGSTSCGSITCLEGGLRLVSDVGGDFESDVAAVFASTVDISGATSHTGTFKLGTNGTALSELKSGTCTIWSNATTIAASTTQTVECSSTTAGLTGITGVQNGDRIFVNLASTTVATAEGLAVQWAAASTTANGGIMIKIFNGTGQTFTWASTASSSIQYLVAR